MTDYSIPTGMRDDFANPRNFINRELSWLEFNRRVLEEAQDRSQPLMERVKFLAIFASNLDEFFEIRVAGIKQQIDSGTADIGPDGMAPAEVFEHIQTVVHEMVDEIYRLWNEDIVPALAENNIHILCVPELTGADAKWARTFFRNEVFPVLTPLAVDASHPFPQVLNKSHNLIVRARKPGNEDPLYAIVQVPRVIPRFIPLPRDGTEGVGWAYIYLASLIKAHIAELFPGLEARGRARLPRHAQQRPLHRRGGGGEPAAHDRAGAAALEPWERGPARGRGGLPARFPGDAARAVQAAARPTFTRCPAR